MEVGQFSQVTPALHLRLHRIGLECFLDYLRDQQNIERAHVSFDHFDRDHLKGWLAWMIDQRHYAARTVALRLSTVKAFLTYSSAEDITLVTLSQAAKCCGHQPAPGSRSSTSPNSRHEPCSLPSPAAPPNRAGTGCLQ